MIISGELSHKDSMGNVETMKRGDVQMTSGGSGIRHSEYNDHDSTEVHFLQIWAMPEASACRKKPGYYTRHFSDADKTDKWAHIVAPVSQSAEFGVVDKREADGPTPIHASVNMLATMLSPAKALTHSLVPTLNGKNGKLVYVQLVQTSGYNPRAAPKDGKSANLVKVSMGSQEATLGEGDGVFIQQVNVGDEIKVANVGDKVAEVVLFEMDA
jgi:redox-sensitive bicupin YhaK (pirin superfamily)